MEDIIKIGILGITGVFLALQFKSTRPEFGMYMGFAICLLIFSFSVKQIKLIGEQFSNIKKYLDGAESYIAVLLKVIGITYVCEFASGICKDGGFSAVAEQIEILGKLSVMFAGLPILFAIIEQIHGFM
jgi:stage III sporulation protein AD